MADQEPDNSKDSNQNLSTSLLEGGLPQLVAGPAGKAISRLLGAAADIPAAWLEGKAQSIRDETEGRSTVSQAIAKRAAETAVDNPEIMERGLNNLLDSSYRKQKNKDEIAFITLRDLQDSPPPPESTGPSDDWLNKFERYAEDASSEELRMMYGKLLSGEIRKPGSITPATLHLVHMLDSDTTKLIEQVLPYTIYAATAGVVFTECIKPNMSHANLMYLEQSGFWTAKKGYDLCFDDNGYIYIPARETLHIILQGQPRAKVETEVAMLSRSGTGLASVINKDFDFQSLANVMLKKGGVKKFYSADVTAHERDRAAYHTTSMKEYFLSDT